MTRRIGIILALAAAAALVATLVGCASAPSTPPASSGSGSGAPAAGGTTVVEKNFAFEPAQITVKVGDTVTFDNQDTTAHNVKVGDQDLGAQQPGKQVTWKAEKAGTFPIVCTIHPSMTGQVVVQ
jgi:plastocyanin